MIYSQLRIAWRNSRKNNVSTVINVLGLAIGVSACLIIYLIAGYDLRFDTFHPGKERIYRAVMDLDDFSGGKFHLPEIPYPAARAIRDHFSGVENTTTYFNYDAPVTIPGRGRYHCSDIIIAEPSYFDIFHYDWLAGNAAEALKQPFTVVLSDSKARQYFGDIPPEQVIGRDVIYNDSLTVKVAGVVADWKENSDLVFHDFISFPTIRASFLRHNNGFSAIAQSDSWDQAPDNSRTFVKLEKGASTARFEAQKPFLVRTINTYTHLDKGRKLDLHLQPLSDIHFNTAFNEDGFRKAHLPTIYALTGIAAFILVIAIINFINLTTARSFQRAKEVGIRKVLGTSRRGLIFQFLTETFILTCFSASLSLMIARPVLSLFHDYIPPGVGLHLNDPFVWVFLSLIITLTTLLAGFYPAKFLSGFSPVTSLKGQGARTTDQKIYWRKGLIVFQFTVSSVFIIGTLIVGRQIHYLQNKDLGFRKDAIILLHTPDNDSTGTAIRNVLAEKIRKLSGVADVSVDGQQPAVAGAGESAYLKRLGAGTEILADRRIADAHFIPLYDIKILAGQNLSGQANDSFPEFLINETCAKSLGFKHPEEAIGQLLQIGFVGYNGPNRPKGPVVGVVADFHTRSLYEPIGPAFITASKNFWRELLSVRLTTQNKGMNDLKGSLSQMGSAWKEVYPGEKFNYTFYDDYLAGLYTKEQKTAQIIDTAMAISILISCMGLFGIVTFTAERRRKELGIRKVLGADMADIVSILFKDFLKPVVLSILIASPIAWWLLNKWLEGFAYRTSFSWWIFALAGAAAMFIALITVSSRAIRTARSNPIESLRSE